MIKLCTLQGKDTRWQPIFLRSTRHAMPHFKSSPDNLAQPVAMSVVALASLPFKLSQRHLLLNKTAFDRAGHIVGIKRSLTFISRFDLLITQRKLETRYHAALHP